MKPIIRNAGLAGLAVVLTAAAGVAGSSYRELREAKSGGAQAWGDIARIHVQRARAANAALDAAARSGGVDPALVGHTRHLLSKAALLPTSSAILDDPKAVDTYKQYQGELTGALFRLVGMAHSQPALSGEAAVRQLRAELPRDELALARARARYKQAATDYNLEASSFPGVLVAAISGERALPAGL